jgi:vacuolar-type H+-ATPase subunit H
MAQITDNKPGLTAEHAMNAVLAAEQRAKQRVEQCKTEADMLMQQARQQAQRIAERVDNRITRIHQRCSRAVTDQVKQLQLEQQQRAGDTRRDQVDQETLNKVVEQIAALLTTPDEDMDTNTG